MTDADVAIEVVEAGARVVRSRFGSDMERLDKGGGDFATAADIEAEHAMLVVLRRRRPDDATLGEESGRSDRGDESRVWMLDPLCGTLNYAAGMQVVAVNAALKAAGGVTAAAVADPFADEIMWTDGDGAFVRSGEADTPLVPTPASQLVDVNLDPPFPNAPGFRAVSMMAHPDFAPAFRPRVVSSSLALAWVAGGKRAAYVTDGDVRDSVHFAAGIALCEAAGCVVTDVFGEPWGHAATGLIAAADAETHAALLHASAAR
jgi:myo-inositol-1(or 4)-monophosphatase